MTIRPRLFPNHEPNNKREDTQHRRLSSYPFPIVRNFPDQASCHAAPLSEWTRDPPGPGREKRKDICHVTYAQGESSLEAAEEGKEEKESTHQPHHHMMGPASPQHSVPFPPKAHADATTPAGNHTVRAGLRQPHVGKWAGWNRRGCGWGGRSPGRAKGGDGRVEHGAGSLVAVHDQGGKGGRVERGEGGFMSAPIPSRAPSLATVNIVPILVFCLCS